MMRNFTIVLLLAAFSGMCFAQDATINLTEKEKSPPQSPAVQSSNEISKSTGRSSSVLPFETPVDHVRLSDGSVVFLYINNLKGTSDDASLSYVPIPQLLLDSNNFFDSNSNRVKFKIFFRYPTDEIREKLQTATSHIQYKYLPVNPFPIKGYEISIIADGQKYPIASSDSIVNTHYLNDAIPCIKTVTDPQLIKELAEPDNVSFQVIVNFQFKEEKGGTVQFAAESIYSQQIEEKIFGSSRDSVLIHKNHFHDLFRDVSGNIDSQLYNSGSIDIKGEMTEQATELLTKIMEQRTSKMFGETMTFDQWKSCQEPLFLYSTKFGIQEIHPEVRDNIINHSNTEEIAKQFYKEQIKGLRELAKKSENVQDFLTKASQSKQYGAGFSYCGLGVNGTYGTSSSNEQSSHNKDYQDMYEKLKDDKYTEEDIYNMRSQTLDGEMYLFFTKPKEFTVLRITKADFHKLTRFIFQNATVFTYYQAMGFPLDINKEGEKLRNQIANFEKTIRDLEKKINDLNKQHEQNIRDLNKECDDKLLFLTEKLNKANEEISNLKRTLEAFLKKIGF